MADSIKYEMEIHCVKVFMGSNGWCLKRLPLFFKDGGIGLENIYQSLDMVPTCLLWLIWWEHNTCIFEDTDRPVDSLMSMLDV